MVSVTGSGAVGDGIGGFPVDSVVVVDRFDPLVAHCTNTSLVAPTPRNDMCDDDVELD